MTWLLWLAIVITVGSTIGVLKIDGFTFSKFFHCLDR